MPLHSAKCLKSKTTPPLPQTTSLDSQWLRRPRLLSKAPTPWAQQSQLSQLCQWLQHWQCSWWGWVHCCLVHRVSPFEQQWWWWWQPWQRGTTNGLLTAPAHTVPTSPMVVATCPMSMTSAAMAAHLTAAAMSAMPATATAAAATTMFAITNSCKLCAPFSSHVDNISGHDHMLNSNSSHVGYVPMTASIATTSHKPHCHLQPHTRPQRYAATLRTSMPCHHRQWH